MHVVRSNAAMRRYIPRTRFSFNKLYASSVECRVRLFSEGLSNFTMVRFSEERVEKILYIFATAIFMYAKCSASSNSCGEKFSTRLDEDVYSKHRLRSRVFESQPISTPFECYVKCMKNCRCLSYNVCNGGKLCELNSEKKDNNISLYETSDECDYYEYQFSKKDVSDSCLDPCCSTSNPCLNNGRCEATCMKNDKRFACRCPDGIQGSLCEKLPRSCAAYVNASHGVANKTVYEIITDIPYTVFCLFTPTDTRTLVVSFTRGNYGYVRPHSFKNDAPMNKNVPNWSLYRLSLRRMRAVRDDSSQWYFTCNYNTESWQLRDSMHGSFAETNLMSYDSSTAGNICRKVKYVNIRGNECHNCEIGMTQETGVMFHVKNNQVNCKGGLRLSSMSCGSSRPVTYFGYYSCRDSNFRCTKTGQSTTQLWFSD